MEIFHNFSYFILKKSYHQHHDENKFFKENFSSNKKVLCSRYNLIKIERRNVKTFGLINFSIQQISKVRVKSCQLAFH